MLALLHGFAAVIRYMETRGEVGNTNSFSNLIAIGFLWPITCFADLLKSFTLSQMLFFCWVVDSAILFVLVYGLVFFFPQLLFPMPTRPTKK